MAANTPPKPHIEGMEWTNTETGIKYMFTNGGWRAVSSSASEEVAEAIDNIDLEKVLGNGNIADKDIVLTDGADDLIDISTTEGRIVIASNADEKTPKLTLAHFGDHEDGNRKAEIELDENGTRLDFEMSDSVKDVHFRFGNDEKFIINHEGDAEFTGKVKVEPGTTGNEVVTASQLAELNQEIEDIRPSLERGLWEYDSSQSNPSSGKYIGYKLEADSTYCNEQLVACQLAAGDDPTAKAACTREHGECTANIGNAVLEVGWADVDFISVNKQDNNGELHTFGDVEIGMYVELMDIDGGGFGLYQIVEPGIASGGQVTGFWVQHISSEGKQEGSVRIKVFEMSTADPADYVRKAGDTMSKELKVINEDASACMYLKGAGYASVIYIRGVEDVTLFRVKGNGQVQAGDTASTAFMATDDNDVVTKKYLNAQPKSFGGPATHQWQFRPNKSKSTIGVGEFTGPTNPTYGTGTNHYYYFHMTSLTSKMDVYGDYDMYFPMNAIWGCFHYLNDSTWKIKQYVPVRNIVWTKSSGVLEIKTHTDYPKGGNIIDSFGADNFYWFSIGGII